MEMEKKQPESSRARSKKTRVKERRGSAKIA